MNRQPQTEKLWPTETPEQILARLPEDQRAVVAKFMAGEIEQKRRKQQPTSVGKDRRKVKTPPIPHAPRRYKDAEARREAVSAGYDAARDRRAKLVAARNKKSARVREEQRRRWAEEGRPLNG